MHKPNVTTRGTARDLADHGIGYTANGESEHSRRCAQTGSNVMLRTGKGLLSVKGKRTTELNLACNEVEILRMKAAKPTSAEIRHIWVANINQMSRKLS